MAISFPRGLFTTSFRKSRFHLVTFVRGGGLTGPVVESADPLWRAFYETPPLSAIDRAQAQAWWSSLRGGVQLFLASDPAAPFPLNYPNGFDALTRAGGGSFAVGTATVTALAARSITVATLPASFALRQGDKVQLTCGSYISLHRILEPVTATTGGVATLNVEPAVPTSLMTPLASVVANFFRPKVKMRIVPDSWVDDADLLPNQIAFEAVQNGF
jgi:hypothetical protein